MAAQPLTALEEALRAIASDLAAARLQHPNRGGILLDLLFASCGIEPEIVAAAETLEVPPGLEMPVAKTDHLNAMKLLPRDDRVRPNDHDDLLALVAVAQPGDLELARSAVSLIAERGYACGRDLAASFNELVA